MSSKRFIVTACQAAFLIGLAGCASVKVLKLDPATGKVVPDAAEGLRFYLPRPYVSVFEPFIVSSEVYLASGEVSPDSSYVLLTEVPKALAAALPEGFGKRSTMGRLSVPAGQVRVTDAVRGTPQSTAAAESAASAASAAAPAASAPEAKPAKPAGGVLDYKMTNDNNAFAVTPQPRYFNILWLPDFDEQYVVTAKAGLGNAGVHLAFGQGWSLQGIEAVIDNSGPVKPLLDIYTATIGSLQKVTTARIESPLKALTGQPQAADAAAGKNAAAFAGGTPVTVKVTKVRIVAPGLYPILKPKETSALDADQARRILKPVQPFTNIAFNTYDVIVIEAARATGDSALRIQQYVDSSPGPGMTAGSDSTTDTSTNTTSQFTAAQKALREELSKPANSTTGREYFTADINDDGAGNPMVTLTRRSGGAQGTSASLPGDDELKAKVIAFLKPKGLSLTPAQVTVKR